MKGYAAFYLRTLLNVAHYFLFKLAFNKNVHIVVTRDMIRKIPSHSWFRTVTWVACVAAEKNFQFSVFGVFHFGFAII